MNPTLGGNAEKEPNWSPMAHLRAETLPVSALEFVRPQVLDKRVDLRIRWVSSTQMAPLRLSGSGSMMH